MKFKFSSLKEILDLFESGEIFGATEISEKLNKSRTIVHKYLKELVSQGKIEKLGLGSHTKYRLIKSLRKNNSENREEENSFILEYQDRKIIDDSFLKFSADGEIFSGFVGLKKWCQERNLDLEEKSKNYISIYKHILTMQDECGLITAEKAFGKDFERVYLDKVYYADQYKWMEFGRGKLAEETFYGKQSQNKELIYSAINDIFPKLECFIHREKFDAIAMTPWSIDRKNQLLKILKNELSVFNLPFVKIIKYYPNKITIPQKSLKTREQRIKNAKNTIFVDDNLASTYKKVLLIDDFVGSGATLNETAKKLKEEGVQKVYGFAFVGNLNLSYDVINEV